MSRNFQPTFVRSVSAWGLGVALLLLAVFGVFQAKALQDGLADQELSLTEEHLSRLVKRLEEYASIQATLWLGEFAEKNSLEAIDENEEALRLSDGAFDAYYVWDPSNPGRFLFPYPARSPEEAHHRATLCLNRVTEFSSQLSPALSAMNLRACIEEEPALRLQAAIQAGELWLMAGRPREALQSLHEADFALNTPLNPDRSRHLASDVAEGRLMAARAMFALDNAEEARAQISTLVQDIGLQSGGTLLLLLDQVEQRIIPTLKERKETQLIRDAEVLLERTRRRLAGFAALRLRMAAPAPSVGDDPKLVYGSPGEAPFLIAYAKAGESGLHGAVQFDQKALLERMLNEAGPESSKLVVRDARGMRLAGSQADQEVIAEVPFRQFLPHLRLGTVALFDARSAPAYRTHFIWQILPILIAGLLGILAMVVRFTADRQERELRLRQQEFATRVTHELKTPLAGIRLMAENLEMGAVNDPKTAQDFAERIVNESDRLSKRVDEILQAARQPSSTAMSEIPLQDLLLDLVEEWEPRFDDAGLILHTELGRCDTINGDPVLIRDSISNLLDNALKYRRVDVLEPQATMRLFQEGKQAVIEVEDNGLGVPPEKQKSIFERFSRVEGPGRGKAGGHGLGLAFAREAIQAHKGRIECRNGLEGGACFTVRIPVSTRR